MADIRALTATELQTHSLFQAEYRTSSFLQIEATGIEPELTWKLARKRAIHEIRRRLDGGSFSSLVELYGPVEELHFIGAFDGTELIGLVTWRLERWNRMVWLCDIRVRPKRQRQGVARRMLENLQWAAMRVDARGIMLETQNTNHPAVQFYLDRGFNLVGLNTHLYGESVGRPADSALFFYLPLGD